MADIYLGTSGWSYKEWEGVFYPKGEKNKLSHYSKYFRTVEIDSTFYAYPRPGMIQGCARFTPDDFIFTAKLPRLITHDKKLSLASGAKADLYRFLSDMKPLVEKEKLGSILIQLPPSFGFKSDFKALNGFLNILPSDVRFAVEFRNLSWLRDETWDLLRENNIANTIVDEPLMPPDTIVTADFSTIRWHGRGTRPWYYYRYKEEELRGWVPKVSEVMSRTEKVFAYHNNHFRGFAVENSLRTAELLGIATQEQSALLKRVSRSIDGVSDRPNSSQTSLV